jgi:Tfp pilus assembly protein PilO
VQLRGRIEITVVAAILLALLVADAAIYRPRRTRLAQLAQELARAEQQLLYLAGHSGDLERVAEFLPDRPPQGTVGDQLFLSGVNEEVARRGLVLTRVEPSGESQEGAYVRRAYKLQIEGSYDDFIDFLAYVERLPEVVLVESFDYRSRLLTEGSSRHRVKLTVTVIGY